MIPADILFLFGRNRAVIIKDLERYKDDIPYKTLGLCAFNYLMVINKPFRNIFYYRTRHSLVLRNISRLFFRQLATVEIEGNIGPGFRISHNYAVIHPGTAGSNLFVGHGATIGKGKENIYPTLGDNVSIYANAVVFGNITVGNNVNIGAGAVVNKDVPSNSTVIGNPMRIINNEN